MKVKTGPSALAELNRLPWVCENCGRGSNKHYDHSCTGRPEDACHTSNVQWHQRRVFVNQQADIFDPEIPIEWFAEAMQHIFDAWDVICILCTKNPEHWEHRVWEAWSKDAWPYGVRPHLKRWLDGSPPPNVWVLASVENQDAYDERKAHLLKIPAKVQGLSVEPMLGPVKLNWDLPWDWVIAGGESEAKHRARACKLEWLWDLKEQCERMKIPFFMKQMGSHSCTDNANLWDFPEPEPYLEAEGQGFAACRIHWRDKAGADPAEWPDQLKIQEFPK